MKVMSLPSAAYLFVPSRIALIFLILECIWRVYVLSLFFSCAKSLLECDFPGYSTLISVTPSPYIRFQWTFLLESNFGFIQVRLAAISGCYALIQEDELVKKKKKRHRKALFILVMILVLTRLMNCSFPTSFKIFLCTLTLLDMEISGS